MGPNSQVFLVIESYCQKFLDWCTAEDFKKSGLKAGMAVLDFNKLTQKIEYVIKELAHYSAHDTLTNIHNLRYFNAALANEISRSQRYHHTFCLLMLDIDFFKKINDNHGHSTGDDILKQLATLLTSQLRASNVVARIGGDEFIILLTEITAENGEKVAQNLLKKINDAIFVNSQEKSFILSISIGLASYPKDAQSAERLRVCADEALYKAKSEGKNRVVVFK